MAERITAPINYPVIAGGKIVKGGSVVFGFENTRPDPDNISTLKPVYLDSALSSQAQNPQGLSSDGVFDQSISGVLFGADNDIYSVSILDQNGVELSYIPSYSLSDVSSAESAQQSAENAQAAESGAVLAESNTNALFADFTNKYFGAYPSDPTQDPLGNPPIDGSLYWNETNLTFKAYQSGAWYLPQDLGFGTAAYLDAGTAPAQVPTNNDLPAFGTAAEANIGTGAAQVPTNNDLGTAAQANVQTSPSDATAGRLMAVGAFGLGTDTVGTELDCNTVSQSKTFYAGGSTANRPYVASGFIVQQIAGPDGDFASQYAFDVNLVGRVSYRVKSSGAWSAWQPVYTGANYQPNDPDGLGWPREMRNLSGGTVSTGGTVSGLDLRFGEIDVNGNWTDVASSLGTYKNVTKAAIGANQRGLFVREA